MVHTPEVRSLDPKAKIKILNPARPGLVMIGVRHAMRYVKQGKAEFRTSGNLVGLHFLDDRQVHARRLEDLTAPGYDRAGRRRIEEIKRLPVVGNVVVGLTLTTKRSAPQGDRRQFRLPGEKAMIQNRPVKAAGGWCRLELP